MSFIIKNTRMSRLNSDHEILYSAIMENDKYKIDRLFKAGIDFNVKYDRGMNILHLAGYYSKSRINLQRNMMEHLLIEYVMNEDNNLIHLINDEDNNGETPLFYCCDQRECEVLIEYGANINHRSKNGQTPIFFTDTKMTRILINNGALCDIQDVNGRTPLFSSDIEKSKLLLANNCKINTKDNTGRSAIFSDDVLIPFCIVNSHTGYYFTNKMGSDIIRERCQFLLRKRPNPSLNFKTKYCDDLIKESIASTIIKSFFRSIIALKRMNILRMDPDNLFDEEFKESRMIKIKVYDTFNIMK